MKKILFLLFGFILFIRGVNAFNISSKAFVAMDMDSGRVIYSVDPYEVRLIASTTKIMTAILAIESGKITDLVEVGEEVLTMYGSNIYIEYKEHMLLLDLVYGLMLRSGNDAAVVIASHVSGNEESFVKLMNNKAKEIGMSDTIFNNPTGLDDDSKNYSTAYDLSLLYSYAYKNNLFKDISGTSEYKTSSNLKSYSWTNRNDFLTLYDKATGGKTGYTPDAGRVLVTSSSNDDLDIVISSFNNIYDYAIHREVAEDIFYNYKKILVLDKDNFSLKNNVFEDPLYIENSFYYPLTNNEREKIEFKVKYFDIKNYKDKDVVGNVYVYLEDDVINKTDILIKKRKVSVFNKFISWIKLLFAKKA
jgi:D-alanyl-D-alanine carboxypeptidase